METVVTNLAGRSGSSVALEFLRNDVPPAVVRQSLDGGYIRVVLKRTAVPTNVVVASSWELPDEVQAPRPGEQDKPVRPEPSIQQPDYSKWLRVKPTMSDRNCWTF